jgi:hypothetical protein
MRQEESFSTAPPRVIFEKVERSYDPIAKKNEHNFIEDAFREYFRRVHPGEIFKADSYRKEPNTLENSDLNQSWRDEAAVALDGKTIPREIRLVGREDLYDHFYQNSPIAIAKRVAKAKMYEAIQKNWDSLKQTAFNDVDINCANPKSCPALDEVVLGKRMPESFFFSYPRSTKKSFVFEFQGVGLVEVDRQSLKTGRVAFGLGYLNDRNKPPVGWNLIRTDVDAGIAPPPQPKTQSPEDSSTPPGQ